MRSAVTNLGLLVAGGAAWTGRAGWPLVTVGALAIVAFCWILYDPGRSARLTRLVKAGRAKSAKPAREDQAGQQRRQ